MNKKGQASPYLIIGIILYNIIFYVVIAAFAMEGENIGTAGNVYGDIGLNDSDQLSETDIKARDISGVKRFFNIVFDLPWWIQLINATLNVILGLAIIFFIRGV